MHDRAWTCCCLICYHQHNGFNHGWLVSARNSNLSKQWNVFCHCFHSVLNMQLICWVLQSFFFPSFYFVCHPVCLWSSLLLLAGCSGFDLCFFVGHNYHNCHSWDPGSISWHCINNWFCLMMWCSLSSMTGVMLHGVFLDCCFMCVSLHFCVTCSNYSCRCFAPVYSLDGRKPIVKDFNQPEVYSLELVKPQAITLSCSRQNICLLKTTTKNTW